MVHIKRVMNKDSWELVNCSPDIYDELDKRGLIPDTGVVSFPGNTAVRKDQLPEIISFFKERGFEYKSDFIE